MVFRFVLLFIFFRTKACFAFVNEHRKFCVVAAAKTMTTFTEVI